MLACCLVSGLSLFSLRKPVLQAVTLMVPVQCVCWSDAVVTAYDAAHQRFCVDNKQFIKCSDH